MSPDLLKRLETFAGKALTEAENCLDKKAAGWATELRNLMTAVGVPIDKLIAVERQAGEDRRLDMETALVTAYQAINDIIETLPKAHQSKARQAVAKAQRNLSVLHGGNGGDSQRKAG